ncbi:MAG TPA: inositol monophosphatase [Candidatus Paceibacterota bacterium]|nr:inositol monophosphatase [Candidatus Paceibacterota bacterium]
MHADLFAAVRETRDMLLPYWGKIDGTRKETSEYSLVTQLDLEVERYLADALKKIDPGAGFVGEESHGSREQSRFWLCDPIDGTLQFARGLPFCTVQVSLIESGRVNLSVIYDFLNDTLYHAARGEGAYQDGTRIHVSEREPVRSIIILETQIHKRPKNFELADRMQQRFHSMRSLVAGYELILVATGRIEARVSYDPWGKDYDYAAGTLLIEEAGGVVANIGSTSYDFRDPDFIAASPLVFRALTEGPDAIFPIR